MKKFGFSLAKTLSIAGFLGGIALDLISKQADKLEKEAELKGIKEDLKKELVKELSKKS